MKYRYGGKEKLLSFGAYPALGIAAAREKRGAAKAMLAEGKDPMNNKAEMNPEEGDSFLTVAQRWHENRKSAFDPAHAERVWSRLKRDVFPFLGEKQMHEITPPDVLEMVRKIEPRGALGHPHGVIAGASRPEAVMTMERWWLFPDKMEVRAHDLTPGPSI